MSAVMFGVQAVHFPVNPVYPLWMQRRGVIFAAQATATAV
jgi:hypothetical protein